MTQAIFRNVLKKNALKNFILNIHESKISIQAKKMPERFSALLSPLLGLYFFSFPLYDSTSNSGNTMDADVKRCLFSCSLVSLHSLFETFFQHNPSVMVPQNSMLCPFFFFLRTNKLCLERDQIPLYSPDLSPVS